MHFRIDFENNLKPPTDVFFSILLRLVSIKFCPPCFPGTRRSIRLGRRRKNRIPRRKNRIPRDTRKGDERIRLRLERNNFYFVCGHYSNMLFNNSHRFKETEDSGDLGRD